MSDFEHANQENSAKTDLEVYQTLPTIRLRNHVTDAMGTKPNPSPGPSTFPPATSVLMDYSNA